jgi:hypothetical protein
MNRKDIAGGWYVDALPNSARDYACMMVDRNRPIETSLGNYPDTIRPLYLRINSLLRIMGQNNDTGNIDQLDILTGETRSLSIGSYGINPCIWNKDNQPVFNVPAYGAPGLRYLDEETGRIYTSDETADGYGLSEYSYIGYGIRVGQGKKGGLWINDNGTMRKINDDAPLAIRARYNVNNTIISIAYYQNNIGATIIWTTIEELQALPAEDTSEPMIPVPTYSPFPEERKLWDGTFFSQSTRYGTSAILPGSCTVLVDEGNSNEHARPMGNAIYITDPKIMNDSLIDRTIAYWVGADPNNLDKAKEDYSRALNQVEKPILFYYDADAIWPHSFMEVAKQKRNRTWLGLMAYRHKNQDLFNYEANLYRCVDKLNEQSGGMPIVLIITAYDRAGQLTEKEIAETYPIIDKITRARRNIISRLGFADRRPDGMIDHPVLYNHINALFSPGNIIRPRREDFWTKDGGVTEPQLDKNAILDLLVNHRYGCMSISTQDYLAGLVRKDIEGTTDSEDD